MGDIYLKQPYATIKYTFQNIKPFELNDSIFLYYKDENFNDILFLKIGGKLNIDKWEFSELFFVPSKTINADSVPSYMDSRLIYVSWRFANSQWKSNYDYHHILKDVIIIK